jgi:hypothetical protein
MRCAEGLDVESSQRAGADSMELGFVMLTWVQLLSLGFAAVPLLLISIEETRATPHGRPRSAPPS